ncbi:MAG TPA: glutathione S-transferase family protein [Solirubrobacteraceae bacterium]|nr:glutathione S-transferase family protein [Solirubrobacteraceae bacterium]
MVRVFHREHAGRPIRALWTLEEIGQPYELTIMTREEGSSEEHRERHPLGRVPVLELDDGFVFESAAVCVHLADLYPEAGLIGPLGTRARALAYQWTVFGPAELEPPLIQAATLAESDPDLAAKARARFSRAADAVAAALGGNDYLVEDRFGVGDVLVGHALSFTRRTKFPEELPQSLQEYVARLTERPAYVRAVERATGAPASA